MSSTSRCGPAPPRPWWSTRGANVRWVGDDGEADLLIPDVVVARADAGDGTYLSPADVLLAVEVLSPSSRTTDTATKRAVHADSGIPAHLVIDPGTRALSWHGDTRAVAWAVDALGAVSG